MKNLVNLTRHIIVSHINQQKLIFRSEIKKQLFLYSTFNNISRYRFCSKLQQNKNDLKLDPEYFSQIDLRIGEILQCEKHPQSDNLYFSKVKVGGQIRQIGSGLQKFIQIQMMKGKVLVMANLKPKKLAGRMSNGMIMCAISPDHSKFNLIRPQGQINQRLYLQGFQNLFGFAKDEYGNQIGSKTQDVPILTIMNNKKKIVQKCLPLFKTDNQGYVVWNDIKLRTKLNYLKTEIKNGTVS